MTNAELIAGLRECATVGDCRKCKMHDEYSYDMCAIKLLLAAADALEAADKQIEDLQKQVNEFIKNETHSSVIKAMSRRIAELEKQEPTEKQVVDYCHKRCLVVIEEELFQRMKRRKYV